MNAISAQARAVLQVLDGQEGGTRRAVIAVESGLDPKVVGAAIIELLYFELVDVSHVDGWLQGRGPDPRTWTINEAGKQVLQALQRADDVVAAVRPAPEPPAAVFVRPVAFGSREAMRTYARGAV